MSRSHAKTETEAALVKHSMTMAHLLCSVSHGAMFTSLATYAQQDEWHTAQFLEYRAKAAKHLLRMTVHGKPYQPVFRPTHFIKPQNLNQEPEAPEEVS